jgi:hypothetical protein
VRPEVWFHLSSEATRNWSTMVDAPFQKSPNCASQTTSESFFTTE